MLKDVFLHITSKQLCVFLLLKSMHKIHANQTTFSSKKVEYEMLLLGKYFQIFNNPITCTIKGIKLVNLGSWNLRKLDLYTPSKSPPPFRGWFYKVAVMQEI